MSNPYSSSAKKKNNGWFSGKKNEAISTGNKDRDDVMKRARAILSAHTTVSSSETTSPRATTESENEDGDFPPLQSGGSREDADMGLEERQTDKVRTLDQDLLEDGVAPLGGHWLDKAKETERPVNIRTMMNDPMHYVPSLHDEASRKLKVRSYVR